MVYSTMKEPMENKEPVYKAPKARVVEVVITSSILGGSITEFEEGDENWS